MRFDPTTAEYLAGHRFSEGLIVPIGHPRSRRIDRLSLLSNLSAGKSVIHVGCVDHLEVLDTKIAEGTWLHQRLMQVTSRCLGIDINAEGIARLRQLGYDDVVAGDPSRETPPEVGEGTWDLVVLGEILEHVDDPVSFLNGLKRHLASNAIRLVVTAPNAFSIQNMWFTLHGQECVNSDHRYWFTPYTLAKILTVAGWTPEEFFICPPFPSRKSGSLARRIRSVLGGAIAGVLPATSGSIVMIATR